MRASATLPLSGTVVIYCNSLLGLPNPGKVAAGSLRWCSVFAAPRVAIVDHADSVSRSARSSVRLYRVGGRMTWWQCPFAVQRGHSQVVEASLRLAGRY